MKFFALLTDCQLEELSRTGRIDYLYRTLIDHEAHDWLKTHMIRHGLRKPPEAVVPFILFPSEYHNKNWQEIEIEHMEAKMFRVDLEIPEEELKTNLMFFDSNQWIRATLGHPCSEKHGISKSEYQSMTTADKQMYRYDSWTRKIPTYELKAKNRNELAFCWTIDKKWITGTTPHPDSEKAPFIIMTVSTD